MKPLKSKSIPLIKICERLIKQFPNEELDNYKIRVAYDVLQQIVGHDWVDQAFFNQHPNLEKKNKNAFTFLKSENIGFVWQNRMFELAERMYNLRNVKNFNLIVKDIVSGQLVSRYAEIDIGRHLMLREIEFEFVKPIGKKMDDFDIKIIDEITVNCEVKHKLEDTSLSSNTIKNTLSKANKQLPKNEFAIIFLKIPQVWAEDKKVLKTFDQVMSPFFKRNNLHIMAIGLRWEEQDPLFNGLFRFMYKIIRNTNFMLDASTENFLNRLESPTVNSNWISFHKTIKTHMI